ncbi:hypothetical protein EX30DRAFT_375585 [Ascodesmis nigricans]|uniref:Uncharacterized protein n=1 Tax=Ascodesmis nigricans TaxID=341454 RepID=A0A4S2MHH9_9PEZI|nr:hypothetical protein EX30DRAFT_375585 [Ascodesmis nigricans]
MASTNPPSPPALQHLYLTSHPLTVSTALINHIEAHLTYHASETTRTLLHHNPGPSSLLDLAVIKLLTALRNDPTHDSIDTVLRSTPPNLLPKVLNHPSIHYSVFRRWGPHYRELRGGAGEVDIDHWVLLNERATRMRPEAEWREWVVSLDDAECVWPESALEETEEGKVRVLKRKMPPREHYAVLDARREKEVRVHASTAGFEARFNNMTGGVLKGLDWRNVLVAGGLPLACLTCVQDSEMRRFVKSDIDVYIYGLTPEEGMKKAQEIWDVWSRNVGEEKEKMVVRNAKTFTFISEYPIRRVQIILKLTPSPAGVLLNFDLDQCAVGWNGSEVLMLPRCARALETGYTMFTSDLIYGHYLGDRRSTHEARIFKYADRGYGILFPAALLATTKVDFNHRWTYSSPSEPHEVLWWRRYNQRDTIAPDVMTGKKAIKRIAYYAEDAFRRYFIGPTEATVLTIYDAENRVDEILAWKPPAVPPTVNFPLLDGRLQNRGGAVGARNGLKMFETFMRMVTAWTLNAEGSIQLIEDSLFEANCYMQGSYEDLPKYYWNSHFDLAEYKRCLDAFNTQVLTTVQRTVHEATGFNSWIANPAENWAGYFNHHLRRITTAPTFSEAISKQLTLPLWAPPELVSFISTTMTQVRLDHNLPDTDEFRLLLPAHNSTTHLPRDIPALPQGYNLYIWLIGPTTSWARFDRRVDEIFEALWVLYHAEFSFNDLMDRIVPPQDSDDELGALVARMLQRRPIPAVVVARKEEEGEGWPDQREKALWRDWCAMVPFRAYRYEDGAPSGYLYGRTTEFVPMEEWFWDEERDGADDTGRWREWEERVDCEGWRSRERRRWRRLKRVLKKSVPGEWDWDLMHESEDEGDEEEEEGQEEVMRNDDTEDTPIEEKCGEKRDDDTEDTAIEEKRGEKRKR